MGERKKVHATPRQKLASESSLFRHFRDFSWKKGLWRHSTWGGRHHVGICSLPERSLLVKGFRVDHVRNSHDIGSEKTFFSPTPGRGSEASIWAQRDMLARPPLTSRGTQNDRFFFCRQTDATTPDASRTHSAHDPVVSPSGQCRPRVHGRQTRK